MQAQAIKPFAKLSQAATEEVLGTIAVVRGVKKAISISAFYILVILCIPILP